MKKLILLAGFVATVFAARYPMVMEYNYLKGCIGEAGMEDYCVCTLNAIEKKYTLNEFITVLQDKEKAKEVINYAVNECVDKLKKK